MASKIVRKKCLLEKFPSKGGWTFVRVPEILPDKKAPFGWVKVKGTIDSFELKNYRLMPMGDGTLFLPVRADVRKKIARKAGDWVLVTLQRDDDPIAIPGELLVCLRDEPGAHRAFLQLTDAQQSREIQLIYSAKNEDLKVDRIASLIRRLSG